MYYYYQLVAAIITCNIISIIRCFVCVCVCVGAL